MANIYTYSFEDTSLTIQHPSVGSYSAYGTGIGTLSVSFTNDVSMHDVAADLHHGLKAAHHVNVK